VLGLLAPRIRCSSSDQPHRAGQSLLAHTIWQSR
jgi:hypothetical protein